MSYGQMSSGDVRIYAQLRNVLTVDLRSDTITKPSAPMRKAMFDAEVGDDVYGEDPTVVKLEEKAARLLGKEAAIFVTSGTMGNLISVMNHCDVRGSEAYCGADSHIVMHEQGGAAQIGGVTICALPNNQEGGFDLNFLERKIRRDRQHEPISKLVAVENTINGKVVPQDWIEELAGLARKHDLRMHLDGARLWNASVASGLDVRDMVASFDSVTFCLSKGLGAPVGSMLCGTRSFVDKARRTRKVLGGGMRQAGVLAAAGLFALDHIVPLLAQDHRRARDLVLAINDADSPLFHVDSSTTNTNMIFVNINSTVLTAKDFIARLLLVQDEAQEDKVVVLGLALSDKLARFVVHYEITDELISAAIGKIRHVIKEFSSIL